MQATGYTKRDYADAGKWVRYNDPYTARKYVSDYQDRTLGGLGRQFAEAEPAYFADIVAELRMERVTGRRCEDAPCCGCCD
jgi:hypothetical protein